MYNFWACCQDDDAPVVEDLKDEADGDEDNNGKELKVFLSCIAFFYCFYVLT